MSYIPKEDIFGRLPDGRRYLIAAKGIPLSPARMRRLGIVERKPTTKPVLAGPSEIKAEPVEPAELESAIVEEEIGDDPFADNATEGAIELAAKHGIDLADVSGTGKDGRILKRDVEALIE